MSEPSAVSGASPRLDRVVVATLLLLVIALAWAFTVDQARQMDAMEAAMWRDMNMSMNGMEPSWTPLDALLVFAMWSAMMAAMMVPGTAPMIAAFATINRRRRARAAPYVPTAVFLAGYLVVWIGFSILATAAQYLLQKAELLTTMMQSASFAWSAALFLAAGLYQFSPLKERCLSLCRSTDGFILTEWRDGALGAAIMGLRHGVFCLGCCAALMVLLFAVAVMDLRWVAALDRAGHRREAFARREILAQRHRHCADRRCRRLRGRRGESGMNLYSAGHRRGVVCAPHSAAVEDGRAILAEGGNAIEAMLAMAASIAAVYPHMNHIGGDGFWLIREPSGRVRALMGAGRAGSKATIALYRDAGYDEIPARGPLAALTVPGAVAAWMLAQEAAKAQVGKGMAASCRSMCCWRPPSSTRARATP